MIEGQTEQKPVPFSEMGLARITQKAVARAGYEFASPIQAGLIPLALTGRDVLGQARTGTGKTAAFLLPLAELMLDDVEGTEPQALVLVPTRELAQQVEAEAVKLFHGRKLRTIVLCGGKPFKPQAAKLRTGVDLIVGTPGRVLDHLSRGTVDFSLLEAVVLDEADRMLDIGFRPDIEKILRKCPSDRQTLLLSATVPDDVEKLARRYLHDPLKVNVSIGDIGAQTIDQFYVPVEQPRKFEALTRLLKRDEPAQCIVFCRTKRGTENIATKLGKTFGQVAGIHGDLSQSTRDRVMKQFREGKIRYLVATDVLGRGIDVTNISHIINYDIPQFCDDYVHRVGRTGRMGRQGVAFTLVTRAEGPQLTAIEKRINVELRNAELDMPPGPEGEYSAAPSEPAKRPRVASKRPRARL